MDVPQNIRHENLPRETIEIDFYSDVRVMPNDYFGAGGLIFGCGAAEVHVVRQVAFSIENY
ncbi:hypothetical protein NXC12_CH01449 [Rhizobium etli]|uniref:Uncharacterized protein n=2 Tax=Rhizobium etli TaxID=29449 RepID=A0AAN1BEJ8_RHIET|nr:hypothetical protein NXC12_CH01449 [Rhizobium etli]